MSMERMLRYNDAAEFLGLSPLTLRKKVCQRAIPFIKPFGPNGPVLFDPKELNEWLDSCRVHPVLSREIAR